MTAAILALLAALCVVWGILAFLRIRTVRHRIDAFQRRLDAASEDLAAIAPEDPDEP